MKGSSQISTSKQNTTANRVKKRVEGVIEILEVIATYDNGRYEEFIQHPRKGKMVSEAYTQNQINSVKIGV